MKNILKYKLKLIPLYLIGISAITSCSNPKNTKADEILKNPKMQNDIFTVILNNEDYLSKFMEKMSEDEKCMKMMQGKKGMVKMMCMSENMDSLMKTDYEVMESITDRIVKRMEMDTTSCSMMCGKVMKSPHLNKYVREHACGNTQEKKK